MKRRIRGAIALWLGLLCPAYSQAQDAPRADDLELERPKLERREAESSAPANEAPTAADPAAWLLNSLSESFTVADGATLRFEHPWGDVRVEASQTDRVHVTALSQYHRDDPRVPSIRFSEGGTTGELAVAFVEGDVAEQEAWADRRIDVGLLVPSGVAIDVETDRGLIEVKKIEARSRLTSDSGDIVYDGAGSLEARTERGSMRVLLRRTGDDRSAALSTLTGDIWCIFLEGAGADVTLETRGPVTTDYSVEIDRQPGSPLKKGRVRIGEGGSAVTLVSHSGGVRLQGLIVPEGEPADDQAARLPGPPQQRAIPARAH
jgi:hypothetical protein